MRHRDVSSFIRQTFLAGAAFLFLTLTHPHLKRSLTMRSLIDLDDPPTADLMNGNVQEDDDVFEEFGLTAGARGEQDLIVLHDDLLDLDAPIDSTSDDKGIVTPPSSPLLSPEQAVRLFEPLQCRQSPELNPRADVLPNLPLIEIDVDEASDIQSSTDEAPPRQFLPLGARPVGVPVQLTTRAPVLVPPAAPPVLTAISYMQRPVATADERGRQSYKALSKDFGVIVPKPAIPSFPVEAFRRPSPVEGNGGERALWPLSDVQGVSNPPYTQPTTKEARPWPTAQDQEAFRQINAQGQVFGVTTKTQPKADALLPITGSRAAERFIPRTSASGSSPKLLSPTGVNAVPATPPVRQTVYPLRATRPQPPHLATRHTTTSSPSSAAPSKGRSPPQFHQLQESESDSTGSEAPNVYHQIPDRDYMAALSEEALADKAAYRRYLAQPSPRLQVRLLQSCGLTKLEDSVLQSWGNAEPSQGRLLAIEKLLATLTLRLNERSEAGVGADGRVLRVDPFGSIAWGGSTGSRGDVDLVVVVS